MFADSAPYLLASSIA